MTIVDTEEKNKRPPRVAAHAPPALLASKDTPARDIRELSPASITTSSFNIPHRDPDTELIESVREHGVIEPVMVRPIPGGSMVFDAAGGPGVLVQYELVFGERRWKATLRSGRTTITAEVRELTDDEVLDLQTEENLHRADLSPLQEAAVFQLYQRRGIEIPEIAQRVHKTERYIAQRLKLLELPEVARQGFAQGRILLGTAMEIACLPEAQRLEAFNLVQPPPYAHGAVPASVARDAIASRFHLRMVNARFPVDDATLVPAAGDCMACPKRTGNQLVLLIDGLDPDDRCTDRPCWESKLAALWQRRAAAAEAEGITVLDMQGSSKKEQDQARALVKSPAKKGLVNLDEVCDPVEEGETRQLERALEEAQKSGDAGAIEQAEKNLNALDNSPQRTWREVLGDVVKPSMVVNTLDGVVELVDERVALEAAQGKGLPLPNWAKEKLTGKPEEPTKAEKTAQTDTTLRAEQRLRERATELFHEQLRGMLASYAESSPPRPTAAFWRVLLTFAVRRAWWDGTAGLEAICQSRGWKLPASFADGEDGVARFFLTNAAKLTEHQLRRLLVEAMCADEESIVPMAEAAELDIKKPKAAATKKAKAELEAAKKGAAKEAKKGKAASSRDVDLEVQKCRKCGCTEEDACEDTDGMACSWVESDLCSKCAGTRTVTKRPSLEKAAKQSRKAATAVREALT